MIDKKSKREYDRKRRQRMKSEDPMFLEKEREAARRFRKENPESVRRSKSRYNSSAKGKEASGKHAKTYRDKHRQTLRERSFIRRYGMSRQAADQQIERQGGVCALCSEPPNGAGPNARLHVDHNHTTGQIRAMLCHKCNKAIGLARENPSLLRKMANYIEEN